MSGGVMPLHRVPGEMLRIGGVKVFTDGGSCNAPAVTFEYANGVGQGDLYFTQPQLETPCEPSTPPGIRRRCTPSATGLWISSWGRSKSVGRRHPRRHRIEHNAVIRPDQLTRYSDAQPVTVIFAPFATCHKLGGEGASSTRSRRHSAPGNGRGAT